MTRAELIEALLQEKVKLNLIGKRAKKLKPWADASKLSPKQLTQAIRQGRKLKV